MIKKVFLKIICFYQKYLSPLFPKSCRFYPSCSEYSLLAIKKYGAVKGTFLGIKRILKCHRFNPGGTDLP